MRALEYRRHLPRAAAAVVAGRLSPGGGARVGPLRLTDLDPPELPGPGWVRLRPRLAGICGSDLATLDGRASRWFEPIVTFPFVPGHEVVGDLDDGRRAVLEPVLGCAARGIDPPCRWCAEGHLGCCERLTLGQVAPGLQTGYCADTGGGWSVSMVAHESQLHPVADELDDEAAVVVEPTACAVHAALSARAGGATALVLGAGSVGLLTTAALARLAPPEQLLVAAKHPHQRSWARELGASAVCSPGEVRRAARRATGALAVGAGEVERLLGGVDVVLDCVGSADSLAEALAVVRPRGRVVLVGMAGATRIDLTPLWQREVELVGAYAYGTEDLGGRRVRTFELAQALVADAGLGRLVSATYPLARHREALAHAADAGARGAVKIAFDLRDEKGRNRP